jgi:putative Holliday junction resolvase
MKIIGLDVGDRWTGIALSDELGITTRPYMSVETRELVPSLKEILAKEQVETVVVGYPKTMGGKESDQTRKVVAYAEKLKELMPTITWVLWDERMTSKQAAQVKKTRTKEEKLQSHAVAAAFILKSYLDYLEFQKSMLE